jgi:glycosyltransferase involved in cell wall biosynthesis
MTHKIRITGRRDRQSSLDLINNNLRTAIREHPFLDLAEPDEPATVEVRQTWPPNLNPEPDNARFILLCQPWEYQAVPAEWVTFANEHTAGVLCYTDWLADCYRDSGLTVRTFPFPLASVLPEIDGAEMPPNDTFTVLAVGGPVIRKNWQNLLQAWITADLPDSKLILKYHADVYGEMQDWGLPRNVQLNEAHLDPFEMWDLYRDSDVVAAPFAGEAWCLPISDAIAAGRPIILTDCDVSREVVHQTKAEPEPVIHWVQPEGWTTLNAKEMPDSFYKDAPGMHHVPAHAIADALTRAHQLHYPGQPRKAPPQSVATSWDRTADALSNAIWEIVG